MKRKLTKILASLLCVVMIITAAPVSGFVGIEIPWLSDLFKIEASASSYSGNCGENLSWSFNPITGALKITGTGDMTNWTRYTAVPWSLYVFSVKSIEIDKSVTSIGNFAFYYCIRVKSITIPDSATSIGRYAFKSCESLKSITIPDSVTRIGERAFCECKSLTSVTIGNSVTSIGKNAFEDCESLTDVCYCGTEDQWNTIEIEDGNEYLLNLNIHFNSTGEDFSNLKVNIDDFTVLYKDSYKLTPKVEADEVVEYEITYTSSNPKVATIDKDGNVTTEGRGIATIFCTVTDEFGNELEDSCQVVVKFNWWQWIIWILLWGWAWY